ncbi:MAG: hypothetical protein IJF42_06610 [Clostridia bacterium]|nr:hypothetical protein [Clostridia bacterium]
MKRALATAVCLILCLHLFGCGKENTLDTTVSTTASTTTTSPMVNKKVDILEYIKDMPTVEEVYSVFSEHQLDGSNGRVYEFVGTAEDRKLSIGDFIKTFRFKCSTADAESLTVEVTLQSCGISNAAQYITIKQKSATANLSLPTAKSIMMEMAGWFFKKLPDAPTLSEATKNFENNETANRVGAKVRISSGKSIVSGEVNVEYSLWYDFTSIAPCYNLLTYSVRVGPYFNNDTGETEAFRKWYAAVYPDQN